jgi:hypothetical protein
MLTRVQPMRRAGLRTGMGLTTSGEIAAIGSSAAVIPVVGPIIAGVTQILGALGVGNGCGQSCITATQYANAAQSAMETNLNAAQQTVSENGCLTPDEVTTLVNNYNTIWSQMVAGCQTVPGAAGQNCVSERAPTGKYNYQGAYLAPILALPVCAPTASSVAGSSTTASAMGTTTTSTSSDMTPLLLLAAAIGALALLR